jgi:acetoacetyl-CoA synthetase
MTAGEVLWRPPSDVLDRSRIGDYLRWLAAVRGLEFDGDYAALWRWSVDDLAGFWRSIWDYFEIITHEPPTDTLPDDRMPGADWFPAFVEGGPCCARTMLG